MQMLNGNVLTTEQKIEERTASGLLIPTADKSYKVVKVDQADEDAVVKEGDVLYVPIPSGTPVEIDHTKYLVINVRDIILIV